VLASATIAALPINAWPKPEFLEILRENGYILRNARKMVSFQRSTTRFLRQRRCFGEIARAKSGFAENLVVIYTWIDSCAYFKI